MITYSTNWMGVINTQWYRDRGLTKMVSKVLEYDSKLTNKKSGDIIEYEDITEHWSGGRIDIRGSDDEFWDEYPYGTEIGLPIMNATDYNRFSNWLRTFTTDDIWTLEQLVEMYERTNPKITWDTYNDQTK